MTTGNAGYAHSPIGRQVSDSSLFDVLDVDNWGYNILHLANESHAKISFVNNTNDKVLHSFWIESRSRVKPVKKSAALKRVVHNRIPAKHFLRHRNVAPR